MIGILQYVYLPDTRYFYFFGWDDHYFRLIAPYLDPAFTGVILVLSGLALFSIKKMQKWILVAIAVTVFALLLTYSRASFLAFSAGLLALGYLTKRLTVAAILVLAFSAGILFLPNPGGEGVDLTRTSSIVAKMQNTAETVEIVAGAPVFGVGFNNLCHVKVDLGFF